jgi:hypothetical protein
MSIELQEQQELQESLSGVSTGRRLLFIVTGISFFEVLITVLMSYAYNRNPLALLWFLWPLGYGWLAIMAAQKPFTAFTLARVTMIANLMANLLFSALPLEDFIDVSAGIVVLWVVLDAVLLFVLYSCMESARLAERHYRKKNAS